ncbi:MAG: isocitrate lyase/PEP mutase family protein [Caulobacteraceae bacterium]
MPASRTEKIAAFRRLHESGCFVLPNPWDVGSARMLEALGFKALASTSAGFAWSIGKADGGITLGESLKHLAEVCAATGLPLNADFQNGFADDPGGVAANVVRAGEAGVAGLSVEDSTGRKDEPLYDDDLALERIKAARAAIDLTGSGVVLTARCEGFLAGRPDLPWVIERLKAYSAAGADCLYAPFLPDLAAVRAVVQAVAPKPVNILVGGPGFTVADLAAAGVRRVSTGGALARAAYGAMVTAVRALSEDGVFQPFAPIAPLKSLNEVMASPTG